MTMIVINSAEMSGFALSPSYCMWHVAPWQTTTFASSYGLRLSLDDAVDPAQVLRYGRMATGDKALVTPHGP